MAVTLQHPAPATWVCSWRSVYRDVQATAVRVLLELEAEQVAAGCQEPFRKTPALLVAESCEENLLNFTFPLPLIFLALCQVPRLMKVFALPASALLRPREAAPI